MARKSEGISKRHSRSCAGFGGAEARCNCKPTYVAPVWDNRQGRRVVKSFKREAEERAWRADKLNAVKRGTYRPPVKTLVDEAWSELLRGIESGAVVSKHGKPFSPSTIRNMAANYRKHVSPVFAHRQLSDVSLREVRQFIWDLHAKGLSRLRSGTCRTCCACCSAGTPTNARFSRPRA